MRVASATYCKSDHPTSLLSFRLSPYYCRLLTDIAMSYCAAYTKMVGTNNKQFASFSWEAITEKATNGVSRSKTVGCFIILFNLLLIWSQIVLSSLDRGAFPKQWAAKPENHLRGRWRDRCKSLIASKQVVTSLLSIYCSRLHIVLSSQDGHFCC